MSTSRIPNGCDQQGRHPEAAECCTELGADADFASDTEVATVYLATIITAVFCIIVAVTLLAS